MKILITGGHLSPALSVIEGLKNDQVFYVGRKLTFEGEKAVSLEFQEITKLGIPFFQIKTGRLQRKYTKHTIPSLIKTPIGFAQAFGIIRKVKPDVILTFGSYISIPIGIVGKLLGIPVVIHEQTLQAGFANKILSKFASKVCISWQASQKYFPQNKIVLTGNPIRSEIKNMKNVKPQENVLYITGGSSGSHAINVLIKNVLEKLLENFVVIHQTGDSQKYKDYEMLLEIKSNLKKELSQKYSIYKFLSPQDATATIAKSTLVIGRAGINTVTELIYLKKPALLIPISFGQKDEQLKNANFLKSLGLGEVLIQKDITSEIFLEKIYFMIKNIHKYKLSEVINFEDSSNNIIKVLRDVSKQKTV